ncbi:DUF4157 domain-containing protein [Granulicella sibirica]|uniref:eCIS core domain-containing protein n=1 Tax=Granulicella sibirica TaxID=2479048 RepID=A0A4Q0SZ16_9BACT|nr:DUF4157 domain-containing protein [Granulicella sibirica]RXH56523.1 hypothetical protein GRAN_3380 [Granulicella sibirica]
MSRQAAVSTRQGAAVKPTQSSGSLFSTGQSASRQISVQRQANGNAMHSDAAAAVRGTVAQPGRPLDAQTRSQMEPHLGYDLSSVRVHTDQDAASSARAVQAVAYTAGSHIAFDTGRYSPGTLSGQQLMAHELTHVVQQSQGPVAGNSIGDGVQVSHPSDSFEREARAVGDAATQERTGGNECKATRRPASLSSNGRAAEGMSVQRVEPNAAQIQSQTDSAATSASAAKTSAKAADASAAIAGVSALTTFYTGLKSANLAARSAEAAEDPPTAEPTSGGINVTDADIPEIKGLDLKEIGAPDKDVDSETDETGSEEETTQGKGKSAKKVTTKSSKSKVYKPADKPDFQKTYHLLNINQGKENSADFFVTIHANGSDIKDGGTEPGQATGYEGGSANSNASVTFKARAGAHDKEGNATARILLGGTNTPPRKSRRSGLVAGFEQFFGSGGPEVNKDYKVQRFGGAVRFSANEKVGPVVERINAGPDARGARTNKVAAGDAETPIVVISLNPDPSTAAATASKTPDAGKTATAAAPAAPATPDGKTA